MVKDFSTAIAFILAKCFKFILLLVAFSTSPIALGHTYTYPDIEKDIAVSKYANIFKGYIPIMCVGLTEKNKLADG